MCGQHDARRLRSYIINMFMLQRNENTFKIRERYILLGNRQSGDRFKVRWTRGPNEVMTH